MELSRRRRYGGTSRRSVTADFLLAGRVRIRLVDANPRQVSALTDELAVVPATPREPPDLVIRFVGRLGDEGPAWHVGEEFVATATSFVHAGRDGSVVGARTRLPLDRLERGCTILCERGVATVPLMPEIVNLLALERGLLPLHAGAVVRGGRGLLATGWSRGGKTEVVLSAMLVPGTTFVADDWVHLDPMTGTAYGGETPVWLRGAHLAGYPEYRGRLPRGDRRRLRAVSMGRRLSGGVPSAAGRALPGRALRAVQGFLGRRDGVYVSPSRLFGANRLAPSCHVDSLVLCDRHDGSEDTAATADATRLAQRVLHSLRHERAGLDAAYDAFRFAFPDLRCRLLEDAPRRERDLLADALGGVSAYTLGLARRAPARARDPLSLIASA